MSSMIYATVDTSAFKSIFDIALEEYERKTGTNLTTHPLADKLRICDSPDAVLNVLQEHLQAYEESRNGDQRLTKLLDPTIHILYLFSAALGEGVGLAFGPAKIIFAGFSVLLSTAKASKAGHNTLVDLFERVGSFLKRLKIYSGIPLTTEINEVFGKIMVEVLSILALSTKEMERGRTRRFLHRLLGGTDIEDALRRLDKLTQEEARMIMAQMLKFTHDLMSATNEQNRDQSREKHRGWLSPPNPSINHNVACESHQGGTTAWLLPNYSFKEWKKGGALLWIHGKPGSGKSIVCSAIIEDIERMRNEKPALMAYYYFDFRDTAKQDARGLLSSLLIQLCDQSNRLCDTLSHLYSKHYRGSQQPSDSALLGCLKDMLKQLGKSPLYIILDALDECPHAIGTPSARERVLRLIKKLVDLRYPNVYICVTSRPESDIRAALDPLAPHRISIHEEDGQKEDIANYINSFVHSDIAMQRWRAEDKELVINTLSKKTDGMFRWAYCQLDALRRCLPANIQHALNRLPETLDGTYERTLSDIPEEKWEHAHRLFQCLIASNRPLRVEELAEVLAIEFDAEGTANFETGWRLEEAEEAVLSTCSTLIMVVNNVDYIYDHDHDNNGSRIVQFSHYSVKEFLTSSRLSSSRPNISRYRVLLGPSHTILAQACLNALLRLDDNTDEENILNFPLAMYAANHWHIHAVQEGAKPRIQDDIWRIFDLSRPHYAAWTWIYNSSYGTSQQRMTISQGRPSHASLPAAPPLFYAARFGLRDLVVNLVATRPYDINATHIREGPPLLSALICGHLEIAKLLIEHGAYASIGNADHFMRRTPLGEISAKGYLELVKLLLKHGAETEDRWIEASSGALAAALRNSQFDLASFLLDHDVDINAQDHQGETPLHQLTGEIVAHLKGVQWLLEHGADVNARDNYDRTPLFVPSRYQPSRMALYLPELSEDVNVQDQGWGSSNSKDMLEIIRLLLYHGADTRAKDKFGVTPLHQAADSGEGTNVVKLLIEHGADVNAKADDLRTPLHLASRSGSLEIVRFLVERGADISSVTKGGETLLHMASESQDLKVVQFFVERGADVNAKTEDLQTPLHTASIRENYEVVRYLVESGADVNAKTEDLWTPLYMALSYQNLEVAHFLVERGADVNAKTNDLRTPLHIASSHENYEVVRFLIERGADVNAKGEDLRTPLHVASARKTYEIVRLLVERGADTSANTKEHETPLHWASGWGTVELVRFLFERGANISPKTEKGETPLHMVSKRGSVEIMQFLIDHGVDVNAKAEDLQTPLHLASRRGNLGAVEFLVGHGADVSARTKWHETPLHLAAKCGNIRIVRFLIGRGADVNSRTDGLWTPLYLVSQSPDYARSALAMSNQELIRAKRKVIHFLITHGADVSARDSHSQTPFGLALASGFYETAQFLLEQWYLTKGDGNADIPESPGLFGAVAPCHSTPRSLPVTESQNTTGLD
ncbi:ankyrin repeat-containing domain protein [Lactarius indigo]|nr:ankyrin repeat-containing domain protein [Lactarius indigo]